MNTESSHIHIFKTDIGPLCSNCQVHKALNANSEIANWSIDPDDADCILRINSSTLPAQTIISIINGFGHSCVEL